MLETLPMLAAEAGNFGPFLPVSLRRARAGVGVGIVGGKAARQWDATLALLAASW